MATRSSRPGQGGRPRATLGILLLLILALFGGIAASAQWGDPKGQWSPKLGLDLEGGRQIILKPQVAAGKKINSKQVDQAVSIIRKRVDGSGVSEAEVTTLGAESIVVSLPGQPKKELLDSLARSSQLTFRAVLVETDNAPPPAPTLPVPPSVPATPKPTAKPSATPSSSAAATPSASSTGANGVLPKAFPADTATPTPSSTASKAATPAPAETPPAAKTPTDPSDLAWGNEPVPASWVSAGVAEKGDTFTTLLPRFDCASEKARELTATAAPKVPVIMCSQDQQYKYLLGPVEVEGDTVTDAVAGPETNSQGVQTGGTQINLKFNGKGKKAFGDMTRRLFKLQEARNKSSIIVDGQVLTALGTQGAITNGEAQITGGFTPDSGKLLADQLKFGALPFSFVEQTNDQISPQLGQDQLHKGLIAGAIGLGLVVLYSLFQYRGLGLVTVASLAVAGLMTYGAVTFLGYSANFRLTMAGVTGLIVAIGVTADSFIVYFERVRDEVRSGRPLRAAVQTGWVRARRTIIISDVVNLLASTVLYVLSESNVKAFAFTLGLTTAIDLIVVIFFTHPLLTVLAKTKFFGGGHKWSGFDPERLGATGVTYAGRGRVTIADRRAAEGGQV